jgi:hypothetical protein
MKTKTLVDWIDVAQDRDQSEGSCKLGNEILGSVKCLEAHE